MELPDVRLCAGTTVPLPSAAVSTCTFVGVLTRSDPVPDFVSLLVQSLPVPPVPWACTVNEVVPVGVEPVVLIVSVEVRVLLFPVREAGENDGVAPVGRAVVTLRATVQLPL